jgi:plasmid stabilization system protein ParE
LGHLTGGIALIATYISATINPGQRRRRATKAQTEAADRAAFLWAGITIHPSITSTAWSKRRSSTHRSHRIKRGQRLPTHHAHHARCSHNRPHIIIKHHMASFTTQITNITVVLHTAHTVIDATSGETLKHTQLIRGADSEEWLYSTVNEFERLAKVILPHMPSGT